MARIDVLKNQHRSVKKRGYWTNSVITCLRISTNYDRKGWKIRINVLKNQHELIKKRIMNNDRVDVLKNQHRSVKKRRGKIRNDVLKNQHGSDANSGKSGIMKIFEVPKK